MDTEVPKGFPPIPEKNLKELNSDAIGLGERLFFDNILSRDLDISCASCHKPEYAFSGGPMAKNVGIGGRIQERNSPPLFNLIWYDSFAWDGSSESIEAQIAVPVTHPSEMGGNWDEILDRIQQDQEYSLQFEKAFPRLALDSSLVLQAIGQYLRTLISANSKYDKAIRGEGFLTSAELAGLELVNDQVKTGCLHCHVTDAHVLGTNGKMAVNGLEPSMEDVGSFDLSKDSMDYGRFKTPSLRNLAYTAPYMHDGRFETLEEVLDFYDHGVMDLPGLDSKFAFASKGLNLTKNQKEEIIAFLNTLNDESFIERYSN